MIRRPPRSTRTHSFPTRRASDLQRVENSRVWIVRAFRILPQLIPAVDSTEELIPRIIGAAFPQRVGVEQHMHAVLRNSAHPVDGRSEEHTSELQSLMRISYAVFCLTKKIALVTHHNIPKH